MGPAEGSRSHMLARNFYRRSLPHIQRDNKRHFVTFGSFHRTVFGPEHRDIILDCCLHDHEHTMELDVVVIMPDHVHMLFTPLIDRTRQQVWSLPDILCAIKRVSAHRINKALGRRGPVWREESFDHLVRSPADANDKFNYIYRNPVRAGLADRPEDYRWLWLNPQWR